MFISRAFANVWSDNHPIYDALAAVVYRVLLEQGACSLATMRRCLAEHLRSHPDAVPAPFMRACREQLASLDAGGHPVFIDSGLQGTFILPFLTISGPPAGMLLYTTAPWLYDTYPPAVYQTNNNYLRDMETVAAYDQFFRFSAWRSGRQYVVETTEDQVRRLASYEIRLFWQLVTKGQPGQVAPR